MQTVGMALRKRIGRLQFQIERMINALANRPSGRRVVFLHVPKCAGSTVNLAFKCYYGSGRSKRVVFISDREQGVAYDDKVMRARNALFVSGHFGIETLEKIRGDAFVFTMLRDPYERLRSIYGHLRTRTNRNPMQGLVLNMELVDFLRSQDPAILHWTDNVMARMLATSFDRSSVVGLDRGELARLAIAHLNCFDHIGFVDSYLDLAPILGAAGLRYQRTTTRENATIDKAGIRPPEEALAPLGASARELALPLVAADLAVYSDARLAVAARSLTPRTDPTPHRQL